MSPREYFPKLYAQDAARFKSGLCGATMSDFWKEGAEKEWPHLDHFLICQYELNLLSQLIYAHFRIDHDRWLSITAPFASCRCASAHGGVRHPLSILWVAERESLRIGKPLIISIDLIREYDELFLAYAREVIAVNTFEALTIDKLIAAIKNDPDCNSPLVREYFESKIRRSA